MAKQTAGLKPWQKGKSGNPGGRPKALVHVRDLARQYTEEAIKTLYECLEDEKGTVRVQAAQALLDRGWGKPTQPLSGEDGAPIELAIAESSLVDKLRALEGVTEDSPAPSEGDEEE